jgi:alpha-mannosidase
MQHRLVVVPHTHWDREWYRTHEQFRYQLVQLLDGLLDLLEQDSDFRHFTLDGQTILLDDYLEVRPEMRGRIADLVRKGRLLIGPWYVLPDEWLVSGEALIRNLRLGLARAAEFGGSMQVGYVPDQFGHVGQLPQIFAGFGMAGAALWRGVGQDVEETLFSWEAPDGTRLLTIYLIQGYGNAAHLPLEPAALARRLEDTRASLAARSRIASLLFMNGSDHLEPQPGLPAALAAASAGLDGASVEIGTLPGFLAHARSEAPAALPVHRGELRSGLRAPLLEGCASARAPQKRADFRNDRLLTRYLEPLAAWLAELGGDARPGVLDLAWRIALQNHPHDSICGCSIDAVHDQMDVRFARVEQIGTAHLRHVTRELGARVSLPAQGFGRGAREGLVAWNPHGEGLVQAEGVVELDWPGALRRAPTLHLRGADGRRVPARAEIVERGETLADYRLPASIVAVLAAGFPPEFMGLHPCAVVTRRAGSALEVDLLLSSTRPGGFDFEAAKRELVERLGEEGERVVHYRARQLSRLRLRFVDALPGHGLRVYRLARGKAGGKADRTGRAGTGGSLVAQRTLDGGAVIANATWNVEVAPDGRVRCRHRGFGSVIEDAVRLVSEGDRGDEYSFDPVPGAEVVERPERLRVKLEPASEAEVAVSIHARYRVPAALDETRKRRSAASSVLPACITLRLWKGLDRVDVEVEVDNTACDHRLRAHLRAPFRARSFEVESAFEVAQRPIAPEAQAFGSAQPAEFPIGATPQRCFATLCTEEQGFSVANRGCSEVEAVGEADGTTSLAVTLLRAVGWLSRDDLVLRPVHAGPGIATPGAQVPGRHRAELCFRLHGAGEPARALEAQRFASPALLFAGGSEAGPLRDGARLLEVDDPEVIVSAVEPRREQGAALRLYDTSGRPRRVRVRWNGAAGRRLRAVDLAGRPDASLQLVSEADAAVSLELRGWQLVALQAS